VKNSDHLFIEASFLEKDKDIAEKKYHLTTRQAGRIAGKANVQRVTPFHFSPRYQGQELILEKEVLEAYNDALKQ
jgi:ribonuclease Z